MINFLSSLAIHLLTVAGYGGLFVLSFLENCGVPIPSEIVMPFSGFLALAGRFNVLVVLVVATLANYLGSLLLYWIGSSGGHWLLEKYGKYVFINTRDLDRATRWFSRHGSWAVFWARLVPVVRTLISFPAGVTRMKVRTFSFYTILGSTIWNVALVYIGYKAGEHWDWLKQYFHTLDIVVITLVALAVIWYISKKLKNRHG